MERLIEHVGYSPNGENVTEDSLYDVEFVQTPLHREIVARVEETPPNYYEIAKWIKLRHGPGFRVNPYRNDGRCMKLFSEGHVQAILDNIPGVTPFLPGSGRVATPNYAIIREKDGDVSVLNRQTLMHYVSIDALVMVDGVITAIEVKMSNRLSHGESTWRKSRVGRAGAIRPVAVHRMFSPIREYAKKNPWAHRFGMIVVYPQPEINWDLLQSFEKAGGLKAFIPEDRDVFLERSRIAAHYVINGNTTEYYQAEREWFKRNTSKA